MFLETDVLYSLQTKWISWTSKSGLETLSSVAFWENIDFG